MIKNITIGSDPEFVLINPDGTMSDPHRWMHAHRLFLCPKAIQDCDYCNIPNEFCVKKWKAPEIGTDGSLGELRPLPAMNPIDHVNTIHGLIRKLDYLPPNIALRGGTVQCRASIGGHIHIGMPNSSNYNGANLAIFLSHFCGIPLRKVEHKNDLKRRGLSENGYGKFGSYDNKSYGIEWRMPASWLISKEMATAALCLAYVVAQNYDPEYLPMKEQQYRLTIKHKIPNIIRDIETMEGYDEYKREINFLLDMIEREELWDTTLNIRDTWK